MDNFTVVSLLYTKYGQGSVFVYVLVDFEERMKELREEVSNTISISTS